MVLLLKSSIKNINHGRQVTTTLDMQRNFLFDILAKLLMEGNQPHFWGLRFGN